VTSKIPGFRVSPINKGQGNANWTTLTKGTTTALRNGTKDIKNLSPKTWEKAAASEAFGGLSATVVNVALDGLGATKAESGEAESKSNAPKYERDTFVNNYVK
jgi:hypothetical protein